MIKHLQLLKSVGLAVVIASAVAGSASCSPGKAYQAESAAQLEFTGYVVDQAGVLGPEARQRLTDQLGRFERYTKHQLTVVTVATLGGEEVGAFTRRLGDRWGVGRKGVNDGIILLVAPRDRKARISVGDGLRQKLPDAFCQEVMNRVLVPALARGQLEQGITAGVSALIDQVEGEAALNAEVR